MLCSLRECFVIGLLACFAATHDARAVDNDNCPQARVLSTLPAVFTIDNALAQPDIDPGCSIGPQGNFGVWFRYDATTSGLIDVSESSEQEVVIAAWAFPTASARCPVESDAIAFCTSDQRRSFTVTAGTTYYIQIGSLSPDGPGTPMVLQFRFFTRAVNDECSAATPIPVGSTLVNNFLATTSSAPLNAMACPTFAQSIFSDTWLQWTAPDNGQLALVTHLGGPGRLALYGGGPSPGLCPTIPTPIQCQPTGSVLPGGAAAPLNVIAGHTYFIQLGSSSFVQSFFELEVAFDPDTAGACCLGASCTVRTPSACASVGGSFIGPATICSPATSEIRSYSGPGGNVPTYTFNAPERFVSTIVVADSFPVADVTVELDNLMHPINSEVTIRLSKDDRSVTLFSRGRRGVAGIGSLSAQFFGAYAFSDAGSDTLFNTLGGISHVSVPQGTFRPCAVGGIAQSFSDAFNGIDAAGTWTLTITDYVPGDDGVLGFWNLRLTSGGPGPCGNPASVCCRGATCSSTITQAACATSGTQWGASFSTASGTCNVSGNATTPCCFADYDKTGGIQVADIFAFLNDWFASSAFADFGGDGAGTPDVADIFEFLNAWFAGGC